VSTKAATVNVVDGNKDDTRLNNEINDDVGAGDSEAVQQPPKEAIITQVPAIIVEYHLTYSFQDEDSPPAKHVALFTIKISG
jgi:hypothetical protein